IKTWAKKLEDKGWNIKGKKNWLEVDPTHGQRFKKYAWYKVFPPGVQNELIYFTVEINAYPNDGDGILVYKMDIQFDDDFFSEKDKEYFIQKRDELGCGWHTIGKDEIENHNWKSLVSISHELFSNHI